jgi:hypothetical protein
MIAARIVAVVPDPSVFRSGRDFAAWIGLVPWQNSSGGKSRLCGISKRGNGSLRRLLVGGAMAAMFRAKRLRSDTWLCRLRSRKPTMLAAVALANKIARAAWAVLRRGEAWRPAVEPCSADSIVASGYGAASTGRTDDRKRPRPSRRAPKVLANQGPSTHGTLPEFAGAQPHFVPIFRLRHAARGHRPR